MLSDQIISFLENLKLNKVPRGVVVLNPYKEEATRDACRQFYQKYYHDNQPRTLLLGINPGRFGSGTTGISFTDPVQLEKACGIKNSFAKVPELSSDFIYRMIHAFGGPARFHQRFFISAVSPLGFTKNGKNINYYDVPALQKAVTPFVIQSINELLQLPINRDTCFCIGEGKNFKFLTELNKKHQWFATIEPLAHPRFIMQYKRKQLDQYIDGYLKALDN